jgi:hypothetical protein|nr:MAG TPA: hypothetical protein [Caudoviricetes sp.]
MDAIENLFNIEWQVVILGVIAALFAFKAIVEIFKWLLFDFLGIETKAMRMKREEHELLLKTANGLKDLSARHLEDVNQSIKHDEKIQENLDSCINEIMESLEKTQDTITQFAENRVHDREQSFAIQKELTTSIAKLAESDSSRDEQINNIMWAQKESLADKINQKYKHYIAINGIPEDEVDEFVSLHQAYNGVGGNHHGDAKFNYCMEHLPIIPVEVKLKYD